MATNTTHESVFMGFRRNSLTGEREEEWIGIVRNDRTGNQWWIVCGRAQNLANESVWGWNMRFSTRKMARAKLDEIVKNPQAFPKLWSASMEFVASTHPLRQV